VGENIAMLSLVIDKAMTDIPPKQRVLSMKNLAGYLGIETVSKILIFFFFI
jgi:hypothetical protein